MELRTVGDFDEVRNTGTAVLDLWASRAARALLLDPVTWWRQRILVVLDAWADAYRRDRHQVVRPLLASADDARRFRAPGLLWGAQP